MSEYICAALNKSGLRCRAPAVEETDWWRCLKHLDWHDTATREEKEQLAILEIEELLDEYRSSGYDQTRDDLDTRRQDMRDLRS